MKREMHTSPTEACRNERHRRSTSLKENGHDATKQCDDLFIGFDMQAVYALSLTLVLLLDPVDSRLVDLSAAPAWGFPRAFDCGLVGSTRRDFDGFAADRSCGSASASAGRFSFFPLPLSSRPSQPPFAPRNTIAAYASSLTGCTLSRTCRTNTMFFNPS